jgi:hypothetical protein
MHPKHRELTFLASNTWCGAQSACEKTSTGRSTGGSISVSYGSGSFSGTEYTDKVSFGGLTVSSQSIGAASSASGFSGVDGIIGFGPVDLTQGTVSNANTVPTFMDNLYSQGSISSEVLGVYFKPESGSTLARSPTSPPSRAAPLQLTGASPSPASPTARQRLLLLPPALLTPVPLSFTSRPPPTTSSSAPPEVALTALPVSPLSPQSPPRTSTSSSAQPPTP